MTGINDQTASTGPAFSAGLFQSLVLILVGVSAGVSLREIFQLTSQLIQRLT